MRSERGYDGTAFTTTQEPRNMVMILAVQCKMARAAVGWGVRELAAKAEVSPDTIARFERGESLYPRTIDAIRAALEAAGVEFLADGGVRLRS